MGVSASWDGRDLMQPISAEQPCGEALEDTPLLASFDAFRVFGQSVPLEPGPEWAEIRDQAAEALTKSKDLRLLAHLGAAVLRTEGLGAFSETVAVASDWIDTFWSGVYPVVDEDAILRRNALNCFADQIAVIDGLRRAPLVTSRQHGTVSLRDVEISSGHVQPGNGETRRDEGQIAATFAAMPFDELQQVKERVEKTVAALQRIDAKMRLEGGPEAAPTFDPLSAQLLKMVRVLRTRLASRPEASAAESGEADASQGEGGGPPIHVGAIRSRQEAIRALDAVADFFRRTEPSSPIPLLLDRARRLVSKDFLEVLADIAPDALAQVRAVGGLRGDE